MGIDYMSWIFLTLLAQYNGDEAVDQKKHPEVLHLVFEGEI